MQVCPVHATKLVLLLPFATFGVFHLVLGVILAF